MAGGCLHRHDKQGDALQRDRGDPTGSLKAMLLEMIDLVRARQLPYLSGA